MKLQAAVLTGDLVDSSGASPVAVESAMGCIAAIADRVGGEATTFSRHRGDGWQFYLEQPGLALTATLLICAELRAKGGLESRIAIGLGGAHMGSFTNPGAVRDLGAATGTAFISSGRALDSMDKSSRLTIAGEGVDALHARVISMIEDQVMNWSREQAEAMALALGPKDPPTQQAMAEKLGITRQAVAARLHAAGYRQLNGAAQDFLTTFGGEPDGHG